MKNQMEDKLRRNQAIRGDVISRLLELDESKKQELLEKYKLDENSEKKIPSGSVLRILIGSWHNNAARIIIRGATEEETQALIEHLFVLVNAEKHNLDLKQSYKDHHLLEVFEKYFPTDKTTPAISEKRIYADRQTQLEHAAKKRGVLKLRKEGKTTQEIAKEMDLPESTVRFFLKNVEK